MEELEEWTQRSLIRWYVVAERAGEFEPYTAYVTSFFLSPENQITVNFPFPKDFNESDDITTRRINYYDNWTVDSGNYLLNIYDSIRIHNLGQLKDWKNNRLRPGYVMWLYMLIVKSLFLIALQPLRCHGLQMYVVQ